MSKIRSVVLWTSGTVTTFSDDGRQMPEYQGRLLDVRDAVLRDAPPEATFSVGRFREWMMSVPRAHLASEGWGGERR